MDSSITHIRYRGRCDYLSIWQEMQSFTLERDAQTPDEIWLLEHPSVFTLGLNGRREHILDAGDIPVIQVDRGGQVTYHGPGQIMLYTLLDLQRKQLGVRALVSHLEACVIEFLALYGIHAHTRPQAPGVYVEDAKIAALGLRIKKHRSYHGLAFNLNPELAYFDRINPCGYAGLQTTSAYQIGLELDFQTTALALSQHLLGRL